LLLILRMGVLLMMLLMFDHSAIAMAQIPLRGVVEGFYGKPWTQEECLSQFCFYGEKGLNAYIYAPVVPEGISIQDMQMVSEIYGRRMGYGGITPCRII